MTEGASEGACHPAWHLPSCHVSAAACCRCARRALNCRVYSFYRGKSYHTHSSLQRWHAIRNRRRGSKMTRAALFLTPVHMLSATPPCVENHMMPWQRVRACMARRHGAPSCNSISQLKPGKKRKGVSAGMGPASQISRRKGPCRQPGTRYGGGHPAAAQLHPLATSGACRSQEQTLTHECLKHPLHSNTTTGGKQSWPSKAPWVNSAHATGTAPPTSAFTSVRRPPASALTAGGMMLPGSDFTATRRGPSASVLTATACRPAEHAGGAATAVDADCLEAAEPRGDASLGGGGLTVGDGVPGPAVLHMGAVPAQAAVAAAAWHAAPSSRVRLTPADSAAAANGAVPLAAAALLLLAGVALLPLGRLLPSPSSRGRLVPTAAGAGASPVGAAPPSAAGCGPGACEPAAP